MRPLRTLLEALRAAAVDLGRRPLFSLLSITAMTVALLTLAGFGLAARGARTLFPQLARGAVVEVYLAPGAEPAAVEGLAARLAADPRVLSVEPIAPERALAEFARLNPDLGRSRPTTTRCRSRCAIRTISHTCRTSSTPCAARRGSTARPKSATRARSASQCPRRGSATRPGPAIP